MLNVEQTRILVRLAHKGQTYGNGLPYAAYHLEEVATYASHHLLEYFSEFACYAKCSSLQVKNWEKFEQLVETVALLHDTLEDTDVTVFDLFELEYPEIVVNAVNMLTHDKSENYDDYVRRVANSDNLLAIIVKYADNNANSAEHNIRYLSQSRAQRARTKYTKSKAILADTLTQFSTTLTWDNVEMYAEFIPCDQYDD